VQPPRTHVASVRGQAGGRRGQAERPLGQEEDAHGVLPQPGVPAGVHL